MDITKNVKRIVLSGGNIDKKSIKTIKQVSDFIKEKRDSGIFKKPELKGYDIGVERNFPIDSNSSGNDRSCNYYLNKQFQSS
jgi:hypothetical protein